MNVSDVANLLDDLAPAELQESYDNVGLIIGLPTWEVTGTLLTLDCTEDVVAEAIRKKCNLIVAHHPILFKGLKSLTGANYVERTILLALKNDIAIYAIHTNLDNILSGVNQEIGKRIGLKNLNILSPKSNTLSKLQTYIPTSHLEEVRNALFRAGAGHIGDYDECSYSSEGTGTFKANESTNPFVGTKGKRHSEAEVKLEMIFTNHIAPKVIKALRESHPYEEVAYDIIPITNTNQCIGSGMYGEFENSITESELLNRLSDIFNVKSIRHTKLLNKPVKRVAFCGGSGSFLLSKAKAIMADVFITGDFKYHEFFDADQKILIIDIGHFESEQFTPNLLHQYLANKNVTFAVLLSEVKTNPVHYFIQ